MEDGVCFRDVGWRVFYEAEDGGFLAGRGWRVFRGRVTEDF